MKILLNNPLMYVYINPNKFFFIIQLLFLWITSCKYVISITRYVSKKSWLEHCNCTYYCHQQPCCCNMITSGIVFSWIKCWYTLWINYIMKQKEDYFFIQDERIIIYIQESWNKINWRIFLKNYHEWLITMKNYYDEWFMMMIMMMMMMMMWFLNHLM